MDGFNPLGFWSRRGAGSVCLTTGKVTSPAEMPYLACLARLYHGVEATSCQAVRNFSALAQLIGDLRSNMLASKVERMMFIRLNRHLVDEVHELDAVNAQARARVAKSAQKSAAAIRRGQACRLTLPYRFHEWPCEWYPVSACPCFSCFANVLGFTLSVCLLLMYHQGVITNP